MIDSKNAHFVVTEAYSRQKWYIQLFEFFDNPLISAVLASVVYISLAYAVLSVFHKSIFKATDMAYFNYLADALLHGQLNLRSVPPSQIDLSLFQGKYYLYWSPMPAIVLMPFVAIFGTGFSDVLFTIGIAGLNVGLLSVLLQQANKKGILKSTKAQRGLLVAFFAFGTVEITVAPYGRVWFTGQQVGLLFTILAYLAAITLEGYRAWFLTGLALAGALLTRNELVFVGVWPAVYMLVNHFDRRKIKRLIGMALTSVLPILLAVGALGIYNYLRFGSYLDNGLAYHMMNSSFRPEYVRYGVFNLYYLPVNFFYQFISYPFLNTQNLYMGGSLFLLSPLFLAAFWGMVRGKPGWSTMALVFSILLTDIPILLLMGTGWAQFGPRYTLDFAVPLILLTGMGLPYWKQSISGMLLVISVVHYLLGSLLLGIGIFRG